MKLIIDHLSLVILLTSGLLATSFPVADAASKVSLEAIWGDIPQGPPDAIWESHKTFGRARMSVRSMYV